ncbi:MAG: hypothetical protein D6734_10810, partial [Candidatus Schekmanbacteria bacterium]
KKLKDLKYLFKINEQIVSKKLISEMSKNYTEDKMLKHLGGLVKSLKKTVRGFNFNGNRNQLIKLFKYSALKSRLKKTVGNTNLNIQQFESIEDSGLTLKELEKAYIIRILKATGGNRCSAAKILGIHRNTLMRKCEEYKIKA